MIKRVRYTNKLVAWIFTKFGKSKTRTNKAYRPFERKINSLCYLELLGFKLVLYGCHDMLPPTHIICRCGIKPLKEK